MKWSDQDRKMKGIRKEFNKCSLCLNKEYRFLRVD